MNLTWTLIRWPGIREPMGGITSKCFGLGFSVRSFLRRWSGIILSDCVAKHEIWRYLQIKFWQPDLSTIYIPFSFFLPEVQTTSHTYGKEILSHRLRTTSHTNSNGNFSSKDDYFSCNIWIDRTEWKVSYNVERLQNTGRWQRTKINKKFFSVFRFSHL